MKEINAVKYFAGAALAVSISSAAVAEPTRGFTIEHGTLAEKGSVSIDVQRNLNNTQAGLRAGFEKFEVILNSGRSEEHTSELQSRPHLVCRLLLEKKN